MPWLWSHTMTPPFPQTSQFSGFIRPAARSNRCVRANRCRPGFALRHAVTRAIDLPRLRTYQLFLLAASFEASLFGMSDAYDGRADNLTFDDFGRFDSVARYLREIRKSHIDVRVFLIAHVLVAE